MVSVSMRHPINSLAPGGFSSNFESVIAEYIYELFYKYFKISLGYTPKNILMINQHWFR